MNSVSQISPAMEYQVNGISLDLLNEKMTIDLTVPRTIMVHGEDPRTQKTKMYMLRVTNAGGLVLQ